MERRVTNGYPGPPPPPPPPQVPYYHNYNQNHHQIHPPPHHHVAAVGFSQYPQNEKRDERLNNQQHNSQIVDSPSNVNGKNTQYFLSHHQPCDFVVCILVFVYIEDPTSSEAATNNNTIVKLYVAPIPKTSNDNDVRQVFEIYGNVTEIILPRDKMTGERSAYCFVKYKKSEEGYAAIAALTDQYTFPGETAPVKVRFADADRERERIGLSTGQLPDKLYVRCLNKQTTKMEVHEVFSRFGVIEDIYMALDDMKISRGYAFVQFSCREMALAAIKGLSGVFTMRGSDQPLTVRFADPKKPRLGELRSTFNAPPVMQQWDSNWHPQPYPQWGNKDPRVVQHHDSASQPNHFPQQNAQGVSEVHRSLHKSESASVEAGGDGQKISSHSNGSPEDQNTESTECDWSEHTCPEGNKYYFHCVTFESTWEKPEEYSLFERWMDQKLVSPNERAKGATEISSEQVQQSHQFQHTELQQQSLSTKG
ncbi:unnamed protein product [Cochlearia groenlandica]